MEFQWWRYTTNLEMNFCELLQKRPWLWTNIDLLRIQVPHNHANGTWDLQGNGVLCDYLVGQKVLTQDLWASSVIHLSPATPSMYLFAYIKIASWIYIKTHWSVLSSLYKMLKMIQYLVPISILDHFLHQGEGMPRCKACNPRLQLYSEDGQWPSPDFNNLVTLTKLRISVEMHLWVCPQRCFLGLTEEGRCHPRGWHLRLHEKKPGSGASTSLHDLVADAAVIISLGSRDHSVIAMVGYNPSNCNPK